MPGLKDRLNQDLKTAMLARDSFLSDTLKGLKAAILNQEISEGKREEGLSDADIETLFAREAKKREEAATLYTEGGNEEMSTKERKEKDIITKYLPKQLTEQELSVLVEEIIHELGAVDVKDMGRVIGAVKAKVGNSAEGAMVAQLVKSKLQ